jgi:hypothetical protein
MLFHIAILVLFIFKLVLQSLAVGYNSKWTHEQMRPLYLSDAFISVIICMLAIYMHLHGISDNKFLPIICGIESLTSLFVLIAHYSSTNSKFLDASMYTALSITGLSTLGIGFITYKQLHGSSIYLPVDPSGGYEPINGDTSRNMRMVTDDDIYELPVDFSLP